MDSDEQAAPVDLRVVAGGEPTAEEIAALVVALTPSGGHAPEPTGPAPWLRAAMIEGVGGRPPTSPADIAAADRHG